MRSSNKRNNKQYNKSAKGQNKSRSNKERNNFQDEAMDKEFDKGLKAASNDVEWYAHDPALLRDAASLSFSEARGLPLQLGIPTVPNTTIGTRYVVPSGILTFYTAPTIGLAQDKTAAVNIMSQQLFAAVRKGKSGYTSYDPNDLALYVLAMTNVYAYINYLIRVYGYATLYTQRNRYIPSILLEEMNVNVQNVTQNLANFRYGINVLINKAASFAVPKAVSLLKRQAFLYQNVYSEGSSVKDNLYMYSPYSFWQYQEGTSESAAGSLVTKVFRASATTYYTVTELLSFGDELLAPLLGSQDIATINGDILSAFGPEGILVLSSLQEDYPITPVFDETVLLQFKNATIIPPYSQSAIKRSDFTPGVTQHVEINNSYLLSVPGFTGNAGVDDVWLAAVSSGSRFMTLPFAEPVPGDVMEASRLMTPGLFDLTSQLENTATNEVSIKYMPTAEIVVAAQVATLSTSSSGVVGAPIHSQLYSDVISSNATTSAYEANMKRLGYASSFKYSPMQRMWTYSSADELHVPTLVTMSFDWDNFTTIPSVTSQRINEAAMLNLLAVPQIAKINK